MITAVDSAVLIDLLAGDGALADNAESALRQARQEGALIIGEAVMAEVMPVLPKGAIGEFMHDLHIEYRPSSRTEAELAGEAMRLYLKRGGTGRVVADFLVGAHAEVHAVRLLTRDRGYYRDYFKRLKVWSI